MGKKSKRSRSKGGGGGGGGDGGGAGGFDDNVVSDSDVSHGRAKPEVEGEQRRAPPALRTVAEPKDNDEDDDPRCEDPFEDVYEEEDDDASYEDVYESSGDEDDDEYMEAMATGEDEEGAAPASKVKKVPTINMDDGANPPSKVKSWNPFGDSSSSSAEKLEMDETAYKMHHALTPEWPSLTLDVVPDKHLGDQRTRFPHVVTLVVGSQADSVSKNKLSVLRMSDLCRVPGWSSKEKTERELDDEMLGEEWKHEDEEEDDEDEDSDSEEEEEELDPVLEHYSFPHPSGGINRVRVCPQNSDIVAVWGDAGTVSLYDVGGALDLLDRSSLGSNSSNKNDDKKSKQQQQMPAPVRRMRKDPFFVYSGHSNEGYALDWSRVTPGRLATADCDGNVHIWDATHPVTPNDIVTKYGSCKKSGNNNAISSPWGNSSFTIKPSYSAHGDNLDNPSVEDLQWSPTESTVLASGECGGFIRIYDIRCPNKAMISNKVHANGADVNVIGWNKLVGNLLASGGDDGTFSVWDLRTFKTPDPSIAPKPLARFRCHLTPITSLEWHPTDESMIVVTDDRGAYVYDLSVEEEDAGEDKEEAVEGEIPPQLLFVHSGGEMTKEARWHPQVPGCIASTSLGGFSVFIPSNL